MSLRVLKLYQSANGKGETSSNNKIANGNEECVKKTTTRPNDRKPPNATNESLTQLENPAPRSVIQLTP